MIYIEGWNTISDATKFLIKGNEFNGFTGKIVDDNNNVVYFVGMPQHDICFSYNYEQTKRVTEKTYNELVGLS